MTDDNHEFHQDLFTLYGVAACIVKLLYESDGYDYREEKFLIIGFKSPKQRKEYVEALGELKEAVMTFTEKHVQVVKS